MMKAYQGGRSQVAKPPASRWVTIIVGDRAEMIIKTVTRRDTRKWPKDLRLLSIGIPRHQTKVLLSLYSQGSFC